jgi:hypothetical protein
MVTTSRSQVHNVYLRLDLFVCLLAVIGGFSSGALDFVAQLRVGEDVWPAIPLVLLGGAFLGALQPRAPWRWALLGSVGVVVAHWLGTALVGHRPADPPSPWGGAPLVIVLPALAGVYAGAIGRALAERQGTPEEGP